MEATDRFDGDKYADLGLRAYRQDLIAIRVDHFDPIWDVAFPIDAPCQADRDFIAHAREDLPRALRALRQIEKVCSEALAQPGYRVSNVANPLRAVLAALEEA